MTIHRHWRIGRETRKKMDLLLRSLDYVCSQKRRCQIFDQLCLLSAYEQGQVDDPPPWDDVLTVAAKRAIDWRR